MVERCERLDPEHVKYAGAFASAFLDLTADQQDALDPVLAVFKDWASDAKTLCPSLESTAVADRLTTAQSMLTLSAEAIGELRAAYAQFEPVLTDAQREKLETAIAEGPRRHRRRW